MNNVLKLMKRELRFVMTSMRFQLIASLIFIFIFPFSSPALAFVGVVIVPYFLLYGAMGFEERSHTQVLIATLPVSSSQLCIAKYLLGFFYTAFAICCSLVFSTLGGMFLPADPVRDMILNNRFILATSLITVALVYVGLILPILFKLGTEKSRYLMIVLYAGIFALVPAISNSLELTGVTYLIQRLNPLILLFISICLYLISLVISTSICAKKEY